VVLKAPAGCAVRELRRIIGKTQPQFAAMIGVSVSTLDRIVYRREFDEPRQLSTRRVGWALSYVQAWIASRPQHAA
jgi:predicted DNA-binding transcriptional regulator AlpA